MKNEVKFSEQKIIVKEYLLNNTNNRQSLNFKKTSYLWSLEISKWSGIKISVQAVEAVCKDYTVRSYEISKGVMVYGMETRK